MQVVGRRSQKDFVANPRNRGPEDSAGPAIDENRPSASARAHRPHGFGPRAGPNTRRRVLSFLKIDGARVSAYFGIIDGSAVYYLSSGREPVYDSYGLGKIHLLKILRWCCEHDVRLFSFLSGVNTLKEKFATHSVAIYRNKLRQ